MAIYAHIENGTVANLVVADAEFAAQQGWVNVDSVTPRPEIGWTYDGHAFTAVQPVVSPQQQALGQVAELAASIPGHITQAQSDAATIATIQPGQALTAAHVTALTNHANGWVTLLGGLQSLLQAQGLS